jgi:hypothetical protein
VKLQYKALRRLIHRDKACWFSSGLPARWTGGRRGGRIEVPGQALCIPRNW